MEKDLTIPNWEAFLPKKVGVVLYRHEADEDNEKTQYQAAFTFLLEADEEEESEDPRLQRAITLITGERSEDPYHLAIATANAGSAIWDNIQSSVVVLDEDGEIFQTIDLNVIAKEEVIYQH